MNSPPRMEPPHINAPLRNSQSFMWHTLSYPISSRSNSVILPYGRPYHIHKNALCMSDQTHWKAYIIEIWNFNQNVY